MPSFALTTVSTTAQTLAIGEFGAIMTGAGVLRGTGFSITMDHSTNLMNAGSVLNTTGHAVSINAGGLANVSNLGVMAAGQRVIDSLSRLNLVNSGTLQSTGTLSSSNAINVATGGNDITNTGTITAAGSTAINLVVGATAAINSIKNSGTIASEFDAIRSGTDGDILMNAGTIIGHVFLGSGAGEIFNHGKILGQISTGSDSDLLRNTGEIASSVSLGDGVNTLQNQGSIGGSVFLGVGSDRVINSGVIQDEVRLGDGNNTLRNSGTILGDVLAGTGANMLDLRGGWVSGAVNGGALNDTMTGGDRDDRLLGNNGADLMNGGGGEDLLNGGSGNDSIRGGAGDDAMGGVSGDDTLMGGQGEDSLSGGTGRDVMTGGQDADRFIYTTTTDSGATTALADVITDFKAGVDVIDLALLSATEFIFLKTLAFSAKGAPEVRFDVDSANTATVQIDFGGDGLADMLILLQNVNALEASNFLL